MQRVLVIGCSGSGKTTLARRISREHDLPWTSLDTLFWQPGWVESPDSEFIPKVEQLCQGERWVIDGTYSRTLPMRLTCADTVIWLDLPRRTCLWGVTSRILKSYRRVRSEMPEGCAEHWDWEFYRWIWNYRKSHDHKHIELLTEWLGCEPSRGGCVTGQPIPGTDIPRRVWWLTHRREFSQVSKRN